MARHFSNPQYRILHFPYMNEREEDELWIDGNTRQPWVDREVENTLYFMIQLHNHYLYLTLITNRDIPAIALQYNHSNHWWDQLCFFTFNLFSAQTSDIEYDDVSGRD